MVKMIPVEIIPGRGGEERKRIVKEGVNPSMIYLIHHKNICKCHNAPSKTIKSV
jgi:hypothetical protein